MCDDVDGEGIVSAECCLCWHVVQMPSVYRLEDEARALAELSLAGVEMPGQYLAGNEVTAESLVLIESFSTNVTVLRRHGTSARRFALLGSDGNARHMVMQTGCTYMHTATDERVMQLLRSMNRLLDAHPQSRSRNLSWHTPLMVQVYPQARLLEEPPSMCSFGEAYEINCARYGREADMPIVHFKRRIANQTDGTINNQDEQSQTLRWVGWLGAMNVSHQLGHQQGQIFICRLHAVCFDACFGSGVSRV